MSFSETFFVFREINVWHYTDIIQKKNDISHLCVTPLQVFRRWGAKRGLCVPSVKFWEHNVGRWLPPIFRAPGNRKINPIVSWFWRRNGILTATKASQRSSYCVLSRCDSTEFLVAVGCHLTALPWRSFSILGAPNGFQKSVERRCVRSAITWIAMKAPYSRCKNAMKYMITLRISAV